MTELFKFFNSAPGDPRTYQAADFADYFGSVLSTGLLHTDNVPGMAVSVEAGTLNTVVSAGKSIMDGHLYENTADLTLTHAIPEPDLDRIDRVVLRLDLSNAERSIKLRVLTGTPSATPVAPALTRSTFIYEISLAQILVRANTVQLLAGDLVDERLDENLAGLVYSLISIPTSQFQAEWDAFMADIQESGFASVASVTAVSDDLTTHKVDDTAHEIGDKALLNTTAKATIVDAINEVFQSGNNVKSDMVAALLAVDPTLPITTNSTWDEIEIATGQISTGSKKASGTVTSSALNNSFNYLNDTVFNTKTISVTGLDFQPTHIYLFYRSGANTNTSVYSETLNDQYAKTVKLTSYFNATTLSSAFTFHVKGDVNTASVTATGFTLPVMTGGVVYNWIAVE